ncbi:MarR family winged helix-turn-helix transcriptional regulator [Clavibacter tessellarius]|uniref:MarR family winged helix-turn-helix transcriptional regulator n=1 Tax=Clavibacter tessellarius TaxID=31965 RepID=UPI00325658F9
MAGGMSAEDELASWPTGRLLSTAARAVEHAWAEALTTLGVTHAGLIALHLLRDGPLSQIQLARSAHVETQTMSRTLERLERRASCRARRIRTTAAATSSPAPRPAPRRGPARRTSSATSSPASRAPRRCAAASST